MVRCLACGGVYAPVGPDGVRYFHACPPIVDAKTGARSAAPNARDENVPPPSVLEAQLAALALAHVGAGDDPKNALRQAAMIAAGAGVETVNVKG